MLPAFNTCRAGRLRLPCASSEALRAHRYVCCVCAAGLCAYVSVSVSVSVRCTA